MAAYTKILTRSWFLEHYYRLDSDAARDCVCDGPDDKGVDGLYVDDNLESIDIIQSKLFQNTSRSLGDTQIKEFAGTLAQFSDPSAVARLARTTSNRELSNLLQSEEVADKVKAGYLVRGVFVTNALADSSVAQFLEHTNDISIYDRARLIDLFVPLGPTGPVEDPITFGIRENACAVFEIESTRVYVTSFLATDLVSLRGIAGGSLFAWNVRQSLGRTKVNREISESILNQSEHQNFLLYHNGLTILARKIEKTSESITISGYTVVNGCQSLTTLNEYKGVLSDRLEVLVRLIEVSPESELAQKITHHTNNQNPISARDLQSNSSLQRRLQKEFELHFPDTYFYRIKRGEMSRLPNIVDNQDAARVLLAFDLQEPWSCHQSYKLFDELHTRLFGRPEVCAHRIIALQRAFSAVDEAVNKIDNPLMAGYNLTKYFLLHLLREALEADSAGKRFCKEPSNFLSEPDGANRIKLALSSVVTDLIIDLNAELKQRADSDNPVDYKRELKSPNAVKALERKIIPPYQMAVNRGRAASFGEEWQKTAPR